MFVSLLCKIVKALEGNIEIDRIDIAKVNLSSLRQIISVLLKDIFIVMVLYLNEHLHLLLIQMKKQFTFVLSLILENQIPYLQLN